MAEVWTHRATRILKKFERDVVADTLDRFGIVGKKGPVSPQLSGGTTTNRGPGGDQRVQKLLPGRQDPPAISIPARAMDRRICLTPEPGRDPRSSR